MLLSLPPKTTPTLSYFLEYHHWTNAIKLLNYQLELKKENKHFNKFSMFYYENLHKQVKLINKPGYFKKRVANNLFYGLEKEFAILSYMVPKSNLGLRRFKFFTYPMRILYYAIALYLLQLTQEFILEYKKRHRNIYSGYGGDLVLDGRSGEIKLTYNSIWYKPHYKLFRKKVRKELQTDHDRKIIFHLDIQNYYDEISIPILLRLLEKNIKPSVRQELCYDLVAQQQLIYFFDFIMKGKPGIPQTDNDISSSFIGYLFLIFGDLLIEQELKKENEPIEKYSIIRYVDDIYVSVLFKKNCESRVREKYINSLSFRIADCLHDHLGLRLNSKTKLFWLNNAEDKAELERNLKKVSPKYEIADEDNEEHPVAKVERILSQLKKLKHERVDSSFTRRTGLDDEILKEVYDERVAQLFKKWEYKQRLRSIFHGFNFDLIHADPIPILILLLENEDVAQYFEEFLLERKNPSSRDIYLILCYLCQTGFISSKLTRFLANTPQMGEIMTVYSTKKICSDKPGYYNLSSQKILKLALVHTVIEQIRLRVLCEQKGEYTVALNHLLNEIHAVCWKLNGLKTEEKDYKATNVIDFLDSKNVPHEISQKISNLFDRRNKSPVSHPDPIAWLVTQEEYHEYRLSVGKCLDCIL